MYQINLTLTGTEDTTFTIPDFEAKDKDEAQNITYSIESGNCLVRQRKDWSDDAAFGPEHLL